MAGWRNVDCGQNSPVRARGARDVDSQIGKSALHARWTLRGASGGFIIHGAWGKRGHTTGVVIFRG